MQIIHKIDDFLSIIFREIKVGDTALLAMPGDISILNLPFDNEYKIALQMSKGNSR